MPSRKFRIGIDLDDTFFDFTGKLKEYYARLSNISLSSIPDPTRWAFGVDWGLSDIQLNELMQSFARAGGFRELLPMPGAITVVKNLGADGHKICIVTARDSVTEHWLLKSQIHADTVHSLVSCGIVYDELHFLTEKKNVHVDILLDDALYHLQQSECTPVCFNSGQNQDWNGVRVKDWYDFEILVKDWSVTR